MVSGKWHARHTAGSPKLATPKVFSRGESISTLASICTSQLLGSVWSSSVLSEDPKRSGSACRAPSFASGLTSTMPLLNVRNSWNNINGENARCCGAWTPLSVMLFFKTQIVKSTMNGCFLVEAGKKLPCWTWRSTSTLLDFHGLTAELMGVVTASWTARMKASFENGGLSKPPMSSSTSTTRPRPVWGLTTMFGSKGLKRLDRHIILGVFASQWLVFGNSSFCLTSIWDFCTPRKTTRILYVSPWTLKILNKFYYQFWPLSQHNKKIYQMMNHQKVFHMRGLPSHLQILLLMNQALTSSRSGRPRSRPTTKLLVIRPIATWPAWSRMLANLSGKLMRWWTTSVLPVNPSSLVVRALAPFHLPLQLPCSKHGKLLEWTLRNGRFLDQGWSSSSFWSWTWLRSCVSFATSRPMRTSSKKVKLIKTSSDVSLKDG